MDASGFGWSRSRWWFDSALGFGIWPWCLVCEWRGHSHCVSRRRVSARHPSNFHLRAQMKVTKAKGLEHQPFESLASATRHFSGSGSRTQPELRPRFPRSDSNMRSRHAWTLSGHRFGFLCQSRSSPPLSEAWSPNGLVFRASFLVTFFWPRRKK